MYTSLKKKFTEIQKPSEKEWELFASILSFLSLDKGEFLLREGQVCKGIYFVSKGTLRTYHIKDGKEINTAFNFQNEFLRELESLSSAKPSSKFIQALEPSEVFFIHKDKLKALYETSEFFQHLGRKILEQLAITEQQYASMLVSYSPKYRYLYILENHPHLIQHIPLQYLASYLGISRESLSRIRKRLH